MTEISRREFAVLTAVGAAGIAASPALAASQAAQFDPLPYVHPELRPLIGPLLAMSHTPLTTLDGLRRARNAPAMPGPPPMEKPEWSERVVPGHGGNPDVKVYVINAGESTAARATILDIHGGGFILGSAKDSIRSLQELATALDCVIVTVEYRLAPETPFPGALEDNYAALKWLYGNADELGVDRTRIAIAGGSAGGGHAAMLAIAARDRGEVPIVFQALTYPMLDDRTGSTILKPPQQGAIMWRPESNRFGWTSLLGVPAGSTKVPAGSVPARERNLKGLPPTFIGVGAIDLFFDESVDYARRLGDAGVFVELVVMPGCFHGFNLFKQTQLVRRYDAHYVSALRQGLQHAGGD